jgi:hypothetical protein
MTTAYVGMTSLDNDISITNLGDGMEQELRRIDENFAVLLKSLGVDDDRKITSLCEGYAAEEKKYYYDFCRDVTDINDKFTAQDEILLRTLDNDHTVDCIRILTLSHRILHAEYEWLEYFCRCNGVSVLVETIDNCLSMSPINASALLEIIKCIRHVVSGHSLQVVTETRGAINACVMSLNFKYGNLAVAILELLNTVCMTASSDIAEEIYGALVLLSKKLDGDQTMFTYLVAGVKSDNCSIRFSTLLFLNRLFPKLPMNMRLRFRLQLTKAGLPAAVDMHRDSSAGMCNTPVTESYEVVIDVDKCLMQGFHVYMKVEVPTVTSSLFEGVATDRLITLCTPLPYTVTLDSESLQLWVETDEPLDDPESAHFTYPLSSIKSVVEFCSDDEMQAEKELTFRIDLLNGIKLNFGFDETDQAEWERWVNALSQSILKKKFELAVWPPLSHLSDDFDVSLWTKQVVLYDLHLSNETFNTKALQGKKKLFQYSYAVLDFAMCRILNESNCESRDAMITTAVGIISQLFDLDKKPVKAAETEGLKARVAEAEIELERFRQLANLREAKLQEIMLENQQLHAAIDLAATANDKDTRVEIEEGGAAPVPAVDSKITELQREVLQLQQALLAAAAESEKMKAGLLVKRGSPAEVQLNIATDGGPALKLKSPITDSSVSTTGSEESVLSPGSGNQETANHTHSNGDELLAQIKRHPTTASTTAGAKFEDTIAAVKSAGHNASGAAPASSGVSVEDLTSDLQKSYRKYSMFAKSKSMPPSAIKAKMSSEGFSVEHVRLLFREADIHFDDNDDENEGTSSASPVHKRNAPQKMSSEELFRARKDFETTLDPAKVVRTTVPVRKLATSEAAKSSLWRKVEEVDLNWEEIDKYFAAPPVPTNAASVSGSATTSGSTPVPKKSVRLSITPNSSENESVGSPLDRFGASPGLFGAIQAAAKMRRSIGGTSLDENDLDVVKPFSVGSRYEAVLEDIKAFHLKPFDKLRRCLVDMPITELTTDMGWVLIRHFPTEEEIQTLTTSPAQENNDVFDLFSILASPQQGIPRCKERLFLHVYVAKHADKVTGLIEEMQASVKFVENGVNLLLASHDSICNFFKYAVSICNYLNAGQQTSKAFALTMESLVSAHCC